MLFLLFQIGGERYALDASHVVEVLPLLNLKTIRDAGHGVVGVFIYHGQPIPAIDLSQLLLGKPADEKLSTRIILINHADKNGNSFLVGLIAEHATEMIRRDRADFHETGMKLREAAFLGPVLTDESGIIQLLHEQKLLPNNIRDYALSEALVTERATARE
jgi:chemotaxis-related protein WspB